MLLRTLFPKSPKCAACGHPKYRHKTKQWVGHRICLNMNCPCPDFKSPDEIVVKVDTLTLTPDDLTVEGHWIDTQGHPLAEHIMVGGKSYPIDFIQFYLQGSEWALSKSFYTCEAGRKAAE